MKQSETMREALAVVRSIPRDNEGPVFQAPWQAEVFAMALTLYERGLFQWTEWAALLSEEISLAQQRGDPDLGDTYYDHWLAALERMVVQKSLGDSAELEALYTAWDHAAQATPHGQPINLPGT